MPHRPVLRAAVVGGLVAALTLPTAAFAGTLQHTDPAKDAQKITVSSSGTTITKAPDNKTADIVHLSARYGPKRYSETVRLRALAGRWFLATRITTPNRLFDLMLTHESGSDQVILTRGTRRIQVVCDGLVPTIDPAHDTVSVTVPADCLSTPHWVRIGVGIVKHGKATGVSFADDALRRGGISEADLTLSRKIHQG
jgi:hypothetical protein